MRELVSILIAVVLTLLTVNYIVLAFTEPTAAPPAENVGAPLNVGPGRQIKQGDLTVDNLAATSITLGGDTRFGWPSGGGGGEGGGEVIPACRWQGVQCQCMDDITGAGEGFLILGVTCQRNMIRNVKIIDFEIGGEKGGGLFGGGGGENKACPVTKPEGCDIYLRTSHGEG